MATSPNIAPTRRKAVENYTGLSRSRVQSLARAAQLSTHTAEDRPPLQDFDNTDIWPWISNWIKVTFETDIEGLVVPKDKKHPFESYPATGDQGRYDLSPLLAPDGSIRIALAGDWGTGTDLAQQVADSMVSTSPELTIHLGDIYYVGTPDEVNQNCLGKNTAAYQGVSWRKGTKGSFALNGNHEMYSGGSGYFDDFIVTLGIPSSQDQRQLRSYFCLETPVWRILGIDTGYNSDTLFGDCKLEQPLLDWLQKVINPVNHRKPTVLLSHHQWFSGFGDGNYTKPAEQIAPFLKDQEIVWLWGHEHRLSLYNRYPSSDNNLTVYARCIGHGGMPNQMPDTTKYPADVPQKVEYWDGSMDTRPERFQKLDDGTVVSRNGYVQMTIQDSTLTLEYLDFDKTSVLKESFVPGGGGAWDGTLVRTVVNDPGILTHVIWA